MAILGVDVGCTFTDAVLLEDGRVSTGKVLTAQRQEESVLTAARAAGAREVERFAHGTTVATNALLERKGARTAFVTNAVRAPLRSSSAFVATVVPCAKRSTSFAPAALAAASTDSSCLRAVRTLPVETRPSSSRTASVNVPPTSTPRIAIQED